MAELTTVWGVVASAVSGEACVAHVLQCGACGAATFRLFFLEPERSAHVQCVRCEATYCHEHHCDIPCPRD